MVAPPPEPGKIIGFSGVSMPHEPPRSQRPNPEYQRQLQRGNAAVMSDSTCAMSLADFLPLRESYRAIEVRLGTIASKVICPGNYCTGLQVTLIELSRQIDPRGVFIGPVRSHGYRVRDVGRIRRVSVGQHAQAGRARRTELPIHDGRSGVAQNRCESLRTWREQSGSTNRLVGSHEDVVVAKIRFCCARLEALALAVSYEWVVGVEPTLADAARE